MQKAVSTVQALGTLAIAGVTALAGGAIAGGAAGVAGTTAAGGATGAGGAGATAASATSAASTATKAGAAGAGGPASIARNAFNPGAALRGAGDVLFRQPGMLGSFGAAMRSLGGTMEQHEREDQAQARWAANQGGNRTSGPGGGGAPSSSAPSKGTGPRNPSPTSPTGGAPTSNTPPSSNPGSPSSSPNLQSSTSASTPGSAATSNRNAATRGGSHSISPGGGNPPTAQPSMPSPLTPAPSTQDAADENAGALRSTVAPIAPGSSDDGARPSSSPGSLSGSLPPPQTPSLSPMGMPLALSSSPMRMSQPAQVLLRDAVDAVGTLPGPLGERAGAFASLYSDPGQQATAARAAVDAFSQVNARGQGLNDIGGQGSAWDRSMTPVIASARQGLPLETMAQDAGFGGNVGGFLANRMIDNRQLTLDVPAQSVPWHPQMSPHDWEMGATVSNALGNRITQGAAARVYHEIRSPETGGGWSAGAQFIQNVQEILSQPPTDPIAALEARLGEMEARGVVSQRAMTLWRANAKSRA